MKEKKVELEELEEELSIEEDSLIQSPISQKIDRATDYFGGFLLGNNEEEAIARIPEGVVLIVEIKDP